VHYSQSKKRFSLEIILLSLILIPINTHAHPSGQSVEIKTGEFYADIGLSNDTLSPGDVSFDFNLLNAESRQPIPFTAVEVTILKKEQIEFRGAIHKQDFGPPGMRYLFRGNDYRMKTIFLDGYTEIATVEFPIELASAATQNSNITRKIFLASLIIVLGVLGGILMFRGYAKKK